MQVSTREPEARVRYRSSYTW